MDCIYIALSQTQWPPKRFTYCLAFTHPALWEQLELGVLLMDTSTLGQVEPGIKPPTFRFVGNLHEPLPPIIVYQVINMDIFLTKTHRFTSEGLLFTP